jgi:xylulokinase
MRKKKWSAKILDYTGINEDQLANIYPSGEAIGKINRKIAHTLGLPTDVLLVTGGHDVTCAALGAGAIKKGVGGDILGTAEIFGVTMESSSVAKEIRPSNFACYCHVVPDRFWLMTLNQTCGLLLRWYRDNFGEPEVKLSEKEGKDVFDLIISKSKPDIAESMILPHFVGSGTPWIDARSKGAIVGLSIHTNKADIIRAILEAVIYEQKISIDIFEKYGVDIKEIRAVGGGSKSRFWLQIRSDILGKTVLTLQTEEASCLGTAILASYALGHYPSIDEAVHKMVKVKSEIEPHEDLHKKYLRKYRIFKKIYPALKKINRELSEITR